MNYNKLIITGNLTSDPVVRDVGANKVVNMRIACNGISDKDPTLYLDVESWDEKTIEVAEKYLKKGFPVLLDGRLKYNEKMERPFLRVERGGINFVGSGKKKSAEAKASVAAGAVEEEDDVPF